MKCPRCESEIPEGYMYCFKCGYAIQIVPDYDVDVEKSMDESRDRIAGSMGNMFNEGHAEETIEIPVVNKEVQAVRKTRIVLIILAAFIFLALLFGFNAYNKSNSYDGLVERAANAYDEEEYEEAVILLEKAMAKEEKIDNDSLLLYAQCLLGNENYSKAVEYYLKLLGNDDPSADIYSGLIEAYREMGEYKKINALLLGCPDETLFNMFKGYMTLPPQFSVKSGTYSEDLTVEVTSYNEGAIYYTFDGKDPSSTSGRYTKPFEFKGEGKHFIKAIFINKFGMQSEISTATYMISYDIPDDPEVSPESGGYLYPSYISVDVPEGMKAYYTTDGTEPDENSSEYTQKLPMRIGDTTYSFILVSDKGVSSNVVTRKYSLGIFNPTCTKEDAVNYVTASLVATGALQDIYGTVPGVQGNYRYICETAAKEGNRVYYLIDEYFQEPGKKMTATGTVYAVDVSSCMLYRTKRGPDGDFYFSLFY